MLGRSKQAAVLAELQEMSQHEAAGDDQLCQFVLNLVSFLNCVAHKCYVDMQLSERGVAWSTGVWTSE